MNTIILSFVINIAFGIISFLVIGTIVLHYGGVHPVGVPSNLEYEPLFYLAGLFVLFILLNYPIAKKHQRGQFQYFLLSVIFALLPYLVIGGR